MNNHPWQDYPPHFSIQQYLSEHKRVFIDSLQKILQQFGFSLTIACIISLFFMLTLTSHICYRYFTAHLNEQIKKQNISIYFSHDFTNYEEINELLRQTEEVDTWKWMTSEDILKKLNPENSENFLELHLPTTLQIYLKPQYSQLPTALAKSLAGHPVIKGLSLDKTTEHLLKIKQTLHNIKNIFLCISTFAFLLILYMSFYFLIQKNKSEIFVLKKIGATSAFIRRPFLYQGFWLSLLGVSLGYILSYYLLNSLLPLLDILFFYQNIHTTQTQTTQIIGFYVCGSLAISLLVSYLSAKIHTDSLSKHFYKKLTIID